MSKTTIDVHQQEGQWTCFVGCDSEVNIPPIAQLLTSIDDFDITLKDDRRSLVKRGIFNALDVVAKQPRDKNRRKWSRLLSLIGPSEAKRNFLTLIEFQQKGIESLKPICLLEKKHFGMVVDSWFIYEYREGVESNKSHLKDIVAQLTLIHQHGYRHEDPNFGNFLIDPSGIMFLIDCRGKPRSGKFSDYYDFMLLERVCGFTRQEVEALIEIDRSSFGYMKAQLYRGYINLRTKWKVLIGRKRSKRDLD